MPSLTERLALLVTLDAQGAIKGFNDLGKAADRSLSKADERLDRYAVRFQKAGAGMLAGAGLAATGLYKAGQAAADLEQAVGGTAAVFGDTSDKIDAFAKSAAQSMGLSEREFRQSTTSFGGQLKGLGFTLDAAADKSVELTKVAADLAATYGGTTAEAVQALGAALRGEADPAERFNLFLNQTRVNAKAVELGLAATTSQVSANAKAQATLALITEQSADALGQFGREADTAAGAQARMRAELENAVAALGQGVAPIIGDLASGIGGLASRFNELPAPIQGTISKAATFGTVATGALGAMSLLTGKVLEGRQRFRDLSIELPRTSRALKGLGVAAGALGTLAFIDSLEPLAFLNDAVPDVEAFENALVRLTQNASLEGLGLDIDKLGRAIERVADPSIATRLANLQDPLSAIGIDFGKNSKLDEAKQQIDALDQALAQLARRDPSLAATAFNQVLVATGSSTNELLPLLDEYESTLSGLDTEQRVATTSMDGFGRKAHDTAGKIEELRTKFDNYVDTLRGSVDANFAYEDAVADAEDAVKRLAEAQGLQIDENTTAADKQKAVADATRDARDALLSQADAAVQAADQAFALAGKTLTAAEKQQIFRDELANLAADLSVGSPLRVALEEVIGRIDHLAQDRKASLELEIRETRINLTANKLGGPGGGARAIGGPVSAGQVYSVNENNPRGEVFIPATSGTIAPVHPGTSGVTSQSVQIVVNNPVPEPASTSVRKLRTEAALMGVG